MARLDLGAPPPRRAARGRHTKRGSTMADGKRPTFNDPDHPLKTDDAQAQAQVVERIKQAKEGHKRRHPRVYTDKQGVYHVGRYAPMGEHPRISDEQLGQALGLGQSQANARVRNPQMCTPYETKVMCDMLGVTLEWLRYGGENAYGKYETPDVVRALYERLGNEDKAHLCYLLKRLAGEEAVSEVRESIWQADHKEWLERHPDDARKLQEQMQAIVERMGKMARINRKLAKPVMRSMQQAQRTVAQAAREIAEHHANVISADKGK